MERARGELASHDSYVRDAKKVKRAQEWSHRDPEDLSLPLQEAEALLAGEPSRTVDPRVQLLEVDERRRELDRAVAPYDSIRTALAAYRARRARSSGGGRGSSGGGGGGGGGASSGGGRF